MTYEPNVEAEQKERVVTLLVPVLNEQDAIGRFYDRVREAFSPLSARLALNILFINDGSSDATEFAVQKLIDADQSVSLLNLSRNFGKEAALAAGIEYASGDAVIPIDVDLQDPPELIPEMIELWEQGADIVNARRIKRRQDGVAKRMTALAFYRMFNAVAERPIPPNVGDFRLLDRQVINVLREIGERSRFNKALFSWVGFNTAEVTYERPAREKGVTGWSYPKLWQLALDGIFASSTLPLRIWTYIGSGLAVTSLLYAAFVFMRTLALGRDVPGYASTVILIALFGGMNMFALGIIGEYVGRIYKEVQQRPLYIIRSIKGELENRHDGSRRL